MSKQRLVTRMMLALVDYCRDHSIEAILDLPDVKERVGIYV